MSKLTLRFNSDELRAALEERARVNRRSLNSEINHALKESFTGIIDIPAKKVKSNLDVRHNLYVSLSSEMKEIIKKRAEKSGRTVQAELTMLVENGLARERDVTYALNDLDRANAQQLIKRMKGDTDRLESLLRLK